MNNEGAPHTILITYTTISSRILEIPHLDVPITICDQEKRHSSNVSNWICIL